jgi:hypothetical protein
MSSRAVLAAGAFAALIAHPSGSTLRYRIAGDDLYRVGTAATTHIVYSGMQVLTIARAPGVMQFTAQADCTRTDAAGSTAEHARFVQDELPDGSFEDRTDEDPDFLTILNQPFAVRLDVVTVRDLRELRAPVPFAAASPVGGGDLRGTLRPGVNGILDGRHVVGVEFRADGFVNGPLPEQNARIRGRIHLDGTAYYDTVQSILLALDARLTIDGMLTGTHLSAVPVRIVYSRSIKIV